VPTPPTVPSIPPKGRLAGIDFGSVRIGIAICDPEQKFVNPLDTYCRRSEKLDGIYFAQLAKDESVVGWIIGLPIHCDGNESPKSLECRDFGNWLGQTTGLPYAFYDERYSSKEARQLMWDTGWSPKKKKKNLDRLAAHLILTHYLQSRHSLADSPLTEMPLEDF
jgi:putative holliday junction resolvase